MSPSFSPFSSLAFFPFLSPSFHPLSIFLSIDSSLHPSLPRGCSELYRVPVVEYKGSNEAGPFEYKFPFRSNNNKWQRNSSSPQQSLAASPQPGHTGSASSTPNRAVSLGASMGKTLSAERQERAAAIPRSVSSDGRPLDSKRYESKVKGESGAVVQFTVVLEGSWELEFGWVAAFVVRVCSGFQ